MRVVKIFMNFCGVHYKLKRYSMDFISLVATYINDMRKDLFQSKNMKMRILCIRAHCLGQGRSNCLKQTRNML